MGCSTILIIIEAGTPSRTRSKKRVEVRSDGTWTSTDPDDDEWVL